METAAPPHLVFFHGKKLENQALFDVSGRKNDRKVAELANRQIFKPTNLENWLILQVTDNVFIRTINWIKFFVEFIEVVNQIFNPPEKNVERKKISPNKIQLCLWNPVTLQSIDLPVIEFEYGSKDCVNRFFITTNPNQPGCMVLAFLNKSILFWDVKRADKCWTSVDYPDGFFVRDGGFQEHEFAIVKASNEIVVRTRIHSNHPSAAIKIEENPKRLVISPNQWFRPHLTSMCAPSMGHKTYHVTCRGELFFIVLCYSGVVLKQKEDRIGDEVVSIMIFKFDSLLNFWNTLGTCSNAAFFISGDQVLGFPTNRVDEGNRVYIALESNNRNLLCTYHIENKTMSRSLLPSLPDCSTPPYWISGLPSAPPHEKADENRAFRETKNIVFGKMLIDHLPFDILKDISSHLKNPVDYLNFRASNKLCLSIAGSAKEWRSRSISMSPLLMVPSVMNKGVSFMVDPVSGNKYNLNTCWGPQNFSTICSSSQGWLLVYDDYPVQGGGGWTDMSLRLYNPMTKSAISLQKLRHPLQNSMKNSPFAFIVTDCKVVGIPMRPNLRFYLIDLKQKVSNNKYQWNFGEFIRDGICDINVNQSNINPACMKGSHYYFLVRDGDIALCVYNHDQNKFNLSLLHLALPCKDPFEQRFIVAGYNDIILSVYVGKEWEWLRVFELDRSEMVTEWAEVVDLRSHNIYLSAVSCICKKAEFPTKGNRVYFPRFHGGRVVYYSLDTRKFHAGEGDSSVVVSYYESKEQLHMSCWFEPSLALNF